MNEKLRDVAIIVAGLLTTAFILLMVYVLLAKTLFLPAVILLCLF